MFLSDDDMVECPYNKSHRMLRKRLQSHLLKCRLSYPDVELRKCPFNITHLVPEPEFTHHATNCPDRKLITQYKYDAPEPKEEEGPKHAPIECDEDWDDTDVVDYNPQKYVEHANVIRKPEGSNPSCRKIFIKQERKRLGDGDDEEEDDNATNNHKDEIIEIDEVERPKSPKNRFRYGTLHCITFDSDKGGRRKKRHSSPSTSSSSKQRSRSPNKKSTRDRSRSPGYRSYRDRSPSRGSPDYSRRYSPPTNSGRQTLDDYNPDEDPYYNGGSTGDNKYGSRAYYDRPSESSSTMPNVPPPPMISYPAPRSYLSTRNAPSSDN